MATPSQIQSTILTGELKVANLVDANIVALQGGVLKVSWNAIKNGTRAIKAVLRQYNLQDYTSPQLLDAYSCLCDFVGIYGAGNIDPNAQIPGQTTVTVNVLQNLNNDQLPINTTNDNPQFILSNYHANYYPLYGNNPFLAPYINAGGFNTGDEQTPPIITRVDPNDPTSDITQILFDYPVATLGYLNISGIGNISTGSPSSGGGVVPITFTYTQADLLLDEFGGYYLQLVLPGTKRPYYASLNGISIPINYDKNTQRFSGFANNNTCVIEISLM